MSDTTTSSLRRRLQLTLRYYAYLWHKQTPAERCIGIDWHLLWRLPLLPVSLLLRSALFLLSRGELRGKIGGVKIIDANTKSGPTFGRVTAEALHLIQRVDPRRFRRIEREVRFIENRPQWAFGSYERQTRKCRINFAAIPGDWSDPTSSDYQWYLSYYATLLIHEATHGHFCSLGIPYIRATRADIERLCVEEEHRFAVRLFPGDNERADALVPPFDVERWHLSWGLSRWQQFRKDLRAAVKPQPRDG